MFHTPNVLLSFEALFLFVNNNNQAIRMKVAWKSETTQSKRMTAFDANINKWKQGKLQLGLQFQKTSSFHSLIYC